MREKEIIIGQDGAPNGYVEVLPNDYDGVKKFPLLIWLHGLGETGAGTDLALDRLQRTVVTWLRRNEQPFIVLVPQDGSGYWNASRPISRFVKWALDRYPTIDQGSMHMAGLSSGGYGIRDFINEDSEVYRMFSTFTPMATNLDSAIPNVGRIVENKQCVWGHAGERDGGANMPGAMARFIKKLQDIDPSRGILTIYKGMGHSAWEEVYDSSGRPTIEIASDTLEGAKLFKWIDEPTTWWDWMAAHAKGNVEQPESIDPIVETYYSAGAIVFKTRGNMTYRVNAGI